MQVTIAILDYVTAQQNAAEYLQSFEFQIGACSSVLVSLYPLITLHKMKSKTRSTTKIQFVCQKSRVESTVIPRQ
jgi:hypothetical protein